ncbi:hypothetical protein T01_9872 [Trichinella spiralis]|uniref:Uncharacterized protein n=1 Tax=Trichinella spiralis TaxID=6334 RepID=A0A0V1BRZ2_TRISP|nr:hypothetical protein T01_9872 [Trichinella spiralis]
MELLPLHCCTATISQLCGQLVPLYSWPLFHVPALFSMQTTSQLCTLFGLCQLFINAYDMGVYFLIKERDFRAEKLIISEMEIIVFGVQELSTVTLSMCHWNWDQKKCLEEEQA